MSEKEDAPTVGDIENGSIEDDLRSSFAEAAKETPAEAAPEAAVEAPAEQPEKPEGAQDGRARDPETGRFVPKEGVQAAEQPIGEKPAEAVADPQPEEEPLDPPVDWKLEQQEAFRALPVAQQKFLMEQVGGVGEKLTEAEKATGRFKALDEVLAPKRQEWARDGLEEHVVLRQLFALTDYAKTKPAEFIQWFAQNKGIDLGQFAQKPAAANGLDPDDPVNNDPVVKLVNQQLAAMQAQNAQLQAEIQRINSTFQTREQQEEQARQQRVDSEINAFSAAMDEKGKPKHPYFPIVRQHMSALVKEGLASTLADAYDQACHANPDVRAKIAAAAKAADERERARQQREKAEAARKAGSSVSGSPVNARIEPQSTGDVFDDLRAGFAAQRGAAST